MKKTKVEKATDFSLKKDEIAIIFGGETLRVYLPSADDNDSYASDQLLTATAITMLFGEGNKEFLKIIEKRINKMIKEADK